ncbi:sterol desaturase family protein [Crocinitomicaceae bacterium]|nr:sterol desaturase family protein [Crocinitomicaceae bacterium]
MVEYGKILLIAMPAFLLLVLLEKLYGWHKDEDTVPLDDAVSSMSSGMTNVLKDVLGLSVSIITYEWMVGEMALFTIDNTILVYFIAFMVIDLYGYWTHRISHKVNLFWNEHVIHHSSEEFNLACALRQPVSTIVRFFTILLIPAAFLGVPTEVIATVLPLHLFMQFWYHTRHINKMGFLEYILVTPSHHRVHHAINEEYLDKNLSQVFIFWDFIFGTFQKELDNVPPVYGISRPARTRNPFKINFQHFWIMLKDAWRAEKFLDKITIWFRPTGWRPEGFDEKYPVNKIDDVYHFDKYKPKLSNALLYWSIAHLFVVMFFLLDLFARLGSLPANEILVYGIYIFITIYSLTDLMDQNRYNWVFELIRSIVFVAIGFWLGNWFGHDLILYVVLCYQSAAFTISFMLRKGDEANRVNMSYQ